MARALPRAGKFRGARDGVMIQEVRATAQAQACGGCAGGRVLPSPPRRPNFAFGAGRAARGGEGGGRRRVLKLAADLRSSRLLRTLPLPAQPPPRLPWRPRLNCCLWAASTARKTFNLPGVCPCCPNNPPQLYRSRGDAAHQPFAAPCVGKMPTPGRWPRSRAPPRPRHDLVWPGRIRRRRAFPRRVVLAP